MSGNDTARLRKDEREALMTAARESQTGCLEGEECCYDSLDAMIPTIERIIAARLDAAARRGGVVMGQSAENDAWRSCDCRAPSGHLWRGVPHDCAAVQRGEGDHEPSAVAWETRPIPPASSAQPDEEGS